MHACMLSCLSHVRLCATPWTAAYQAPLSMGFSRRGEICLKTDHQKCLSVVKSTKDDKTSFFLSTALVFLEKEDWMQWDYCEGVEGHLCFFVSHKSLASILENLKSKCSARTERWSLCLWPRATRVIYRAGTNSPADCVSCHPSCETKPTRREETVVGTLVREVRPLHQGGRATFRIAGQWEGLRRAHF